MTEFRAKRVSKEYTHEIAAAPVAIFPLLCPVREYDWIDGWSSEMVYSESGIAENNCVFRSSFSRGVEETWVVSRYEPGVLIQFVVMSPQSHVMKFDISLQEAEDGATLVRFTQTFTGLSDTGNALVTDYADKGFEAVMKRLVESLEHYLQKGTMLKRHSMLAALQSWLHHR